jgi:2-polyprenyl-6-hydroxyphenyl methylase / 3-demethylubiquinone-9 3-methyltransferase
LKGWLLDNNVTTIAESGVTYHPLANEWRRSNDMGVNYMVVEERG